MNAVMYEAFSDELTKIALMNAVSNGFNSALKEGWNNSGGWMAGKGKVTKYLPLGGKSLTVGMTALQAPGAFAQQDPAGQDRSRTERIMGLGGSTVGGFAGTGAGNIAAKSISNKLTKNRMANLSYSPASAVKPSLVGRAAKATSLVRGRGMLGGAGQLIGGIAGSILGEKILTAPSRFLRQRRQDQMQRHAIGQQEVPPEQGAVV